MTELASSVRPGLAKEQARAVIRKHSKSFSLASVLLGPELRDAASGLYAYCRRADDAVDLGPAASAALRVSELRAELDDVYAGRTLREAVLVEFQRLVFETGIPRAYPEALLEGFQLDAEGKQYDTMFELHHYCWCVAGSVGAMMCHVLGVRRERALRHAAHLGMAMQLTNICRDVAEDFERGRVYLPREVAPELPRGGVASRLPRAFAGVCACAVRRLLAEADVLYASGDLGLPYLSLRSRLAVSTARHVYAAIGRKLLARDADVLGGRVFVSGPEKAWQLTRAAVGSLLIATVTPPFRAARLQQPLRFPEDVLPF